MTTHRTRTLLRVLFLTFGSICSQFGITAKAQDPASAAEVVDAGKSLYDYLQGKSADQKQADWQNNVTAQLADLKRDAEKTIALQYETLQKLDAITAKLDFTHVRDKSDLTLNAARVALDSPANQTTLTGNISEAGRQLLEITDDGNYGFTPYKTVILSYAYFERASTLEKGQNKTLKLSADTKGAVVQYLQRAIDPNYPGSFQAVLDKANQSLTTMKTDFINLIDVAY